MLVLGQGDADLAAVGLRDKAPALEVLPGHVVALGPDEAEDVLLAAVLADEGGGEAEAPHRLYLGHDAEDGSGKEMHLVVDDEAPLLPAEKVEVGEVRVLVGPPGEDLIGRDRHRPHGLLRARVFADRVGRKSVLSASSSIHWWTAAMLVVTMRVLRPMAAIAAIATIVLPAPQGMTTTP